jgi:steroid 5-alpha reductase family enzyme
LKALNPDNFIRIVKKRNEEPRAAVTVKVCDVLEAAMIELVLAVLGVMAVIMLIGWTVQRGAGNGGWTDVFWTYGTGATCALASLTPIGAQPGVGWRRALVAVMAAAWALRLGGYIAVRVARSREDARYTELRGEWGAKFQRNMFALLIAQAPITALISISVLAAARQPEPGFRWQDALGVAILLGSVLGETLSDRQMKLFKADPANAGRVCDQGLWGWSRHPNYFFEALVWVAYPVIGIDPARPWTWAALIAPAMMIWVVRFGTGVPPLEKAMVKSKGEAYRLYQAEVSPFLPRPRRRRRAAP